MKYIKIKIVVCIGVNYDAICVSVYHQEHYQ